MTLARWATGLSLGAAARHRDDPHLAVRRCRQASASRSPIATVTWHALWFLWTLRQREEPAELNYPQMSQMRQIPSQTQRVTLAFIAAYMAQYPVDILCRCLGVTRSGYYARCQQWPSPLRRG